MSALEPADRARLRPSTVLVLVGTAVGLAIVVFAAGSWAGTYYSNVRVQSVVAGAVGVLAWLAVALVRPEVRPSSRLTGGFAAALAAFAVSALAAPIPRYALDYLGYAVLLTALYLLLVRLWAAPTIASRLGILVAVMCGVGGVLHIAKVVAGWVLLWSRLGMVVVPPLRLESEGLWTGSANAFAAFQVLLLTVAVPTLWGSGRRGRGFASLLVVVVAVNVLLCASRGAWLGVAVATVATIFSFALTSRGLIRAGAPALARERRVVVTAVVAVVAVVAVAALMGSALVARLTDFAGAGLRGDFIAASVRMFLAAPATGLGPGSWVPERLRYTDSTERDFYIPHAHNVPAQVLAEFGLVGIIASAIVVALLVRMFAGGLRSSTTRKRGVALGAIFACTYLFAHQLVDSFAPQPAILAALALPLAKLDAALGLTAGSESQARATASRGWRTLRPPSLVLPVTLVLAVVVGTYSALWPEPAAQLGEQAVTAADAGRWDEAYGLATRAAAEDPDIATYQLLRGLGAARAGDLAVARDAFQAAAALDDYPAAWLNLAAVRVRLGEPGVREALDRAVRLGRQQPAIAVAAAGLYHELGDDRAAADLLVDAFSHAPSLAGDALWSTESWSDPAGAAIRRAISESDPWTALLVSLEAGRPDQAPTLADAAQQAGYSLAADTAAAWLGDEQAFARLHGRAAANPLDGTTVGLCLRIAELHDGHDGTRPWQCPGRWVVGAYPVVRIGAPNRSPDMPGPAALPHALYAYRRPGPQDSILPWLLQVFASPA